jgi:P-type Na+/K+ transporter
MGGLCIGSIYFHLYALGGKTLGRDCNTTWSPDCDIVFRTRATGFACLTWDSLFLAWQMMDMNRSFFWMNPDSRKRDLAKDLAKHLWGNQLLFWSVMFGIFAIFPLIYIPTLNTVILKSTGISWEWGIVAIQSVLFFVGTEA